MAIPGTKLPGWGGALGAIAKAIAAVGAAVEKSGSDDDLLDVQHGGSGELRFSLASGAAGGEVTPLDNAAFLAEATANGNAFDVEMLGGTVQGFFGGIQVIDSTQWSGIADGELFWLQYDPEETPGSQWSVEHDDDLPPDAVVPDSGNPNYFTVVPLFRVEAGRPRNVIQYMAFSVYVPTATNVVQIQRIPSGA